MKKKLMVLAFFSFFLAKGAIAEEIKAVVTFEKLSKEESSALLKEHNRVRGDAGVKALQWSEELSAYAEKWADYLAENACSLQHRPEKGKWKQKYGENISMGTANLLGLLYTVKSWENEKKDYRYGPVYKKDLLKTGSYTQLIWKDTERVGCAKALCSGNMIVVCNYDPPGNVPGEKPY